MIYNTINQDFLKTQQYRDAVNLSARGNLHARFRTNPYPWFQWVFDHIKLPPDAYVLELGCGAGWLWQENIHRIPRRWRIILTDFSPGMLAEAQKNLGPSGRSFEYREVDAQSIPYPDRMFDAVIANHMLYHIPDRAKAIRDIHRVLKPGGKLYAATNGENHLKELHELTDRWQPGMSQIEKKVFRADEFTLENGAEQLKPPFSQVTLDIYEDSLKVTEAEPLIDYILSMNIAGPARYEPEVLQKLHDIVKSELSKDGVFHIQKSTGLFIAIK